MSLPNDIQKSIDEANELLGKSANPAEAAPEPVKGAEAEQSTTDKPGEEAQPADPVEQPHHDAAYWEHRFNVMKGKYNNEIPALRQEIATLKTQIATTDQSAQGAVNRVMGLTDEEVEEFGPELVELVQKIVGNTGVDKSRIEALESKIATQDELSANEADDRFWDSLHKAVPDFVEINSQPAFLAWLREMDPKVSEYRQKILEEAQRAKDSGRVAQLFMEFKSSAQTSPAAQQVPEERIEVPRSKSESPDMTQARIWTGDEIKQFYTDVAAGKYKHSKEEMMATEHDIMKAQSEGRIRG